MAATQYQRSDSSYPYQVGIISPLSDHSAHINIYLHKLAHYDRDTAVLVAQVLYFAHRTLVENVSNSGFFNRNSDTLEITVALGIEMLQAWCSLGLVDSFAPPVSLHQFPKDLHGKLGSLPATGGDLALHIKSNRRDLCFIAAKAIVDRLSQIRISERDNVISRMEETYGFIYKKGKQGIGRDLSEFEDGTENPHGQERLDAALIKPDQDARHVNGSFLYMARFVHTRMPWLKQHSVTQQEQVIGRTMDDSVELDDNVRSPNSHVTRSMAHDPETGEEADIVRHSAVYGTVQENGLFFVSYSDTLQKMTDILYRMVGEDADSKALPDYEHTYTGDSLLKFTTCVTSQYYYAPSVAELEKMARHGAMSKL